MKELTTARHDISSDQEEKHQRTETLVTLHPSREHLFRLRRCETPRVVHTACVFSPTKSLLLKYLSGEHKTPTSPVIDVIGRFSKYFTLYF